MDGHHARRVRGHEFEVVVPWREVIENMTPDPPEPRELRCQCCGGYAGHGTTNPEFCSFCREAGEHEP